MGLRETKPWLTDDEILDYFATVEGVALHSSTQDGQPEQTRDGLDRAWAVLSALVRETAEPRTRVAIVGGGIAGLYCAFELANRHGFESTVLEAAPRFGGRIETRKMGEFKAEFGPMRFEPNIQPLLTALVKQLQLDREWGEFTGTSIDEAAALSRSARYNLRHDELRHTWDVLPARTGQGSAPRKTSPLDLLRLGVARMFRPAMWKYLSQVTKPEDCGRPDEFDLCVDTTVAPPAGSWLEQPYQPGKRQWSCPGWDVKQLALDNNLEEETSTPLERQRERRVLVQEWLDSLDDRGYDELRRKATHREGHLLRDEGFWNAMSEELSPSAVSFIRDEGTFYHLFPDNPNVVEWGIFWLRLLRTSANS